MSRWIVKRDGVLGGKPYVRGTRLTVEYIRREMATGRSAEDLMRAYPALTEEALEAARRYTVQVVDKGVLRPQNFRGYRRPRRYVGPADADDHHGGWS